MRRTHEGTGDLQNVLITFVNEDDKRVGRAITRTLYERRKADPTRREKREQIQTNGSVVT